MVDDTSVTEGALASENLTIVTTVTVAESATVTDTWSYVFYPGGNIAVAANATEVWAWGPALRSVSLTSAANATDGWTLGGAVSLSSSAAATEAWTLAVQNAVSEVARASSQVSVSAAYNLAQASLATATESWAFEHTRSVSDTATASDAVSFTYQGGVQISETANASEVMTPRRTVNLTMVETAQASVTLSSIMAYSVTVIEDAVASDWASPSNSVTAWAINTRTQFISEYQNFAFNSFAQMGRRYVAADADGLYELTGPNDDGDDVVGRLGGGYFAPNGSKMSGFKGAYLGARGQGAYTLKLLAGDGREWVYQTVLNPNLMTTKFNIGKGLKARYYAWELIAADGQDFSLDVVEFIPAMSGRRV